MSMLCIWEEGWPSQHRWWRWIGRALLCLSATVSLAAAPAPDREEVAQALEGTAHRRLDAKSALRFFQLVTAFDDATNAVATAAVSYAEATEHLQALEAAHAAQFGLDPAKQYLYERSSGKLFRLEIQAGTPPQVVRILERKMEPEEGQAYLTAQVQRVELAAKQQTATETISNEELAATQALGALKTEFGVQDHAWADIYLVPGSMDVMLVQGRYPVLPPVPKVPTRGGEVPDGTFWVYDVAFTFPENSERVMTRLADLTGRLEAAPPSEITHASEEWGTEQVAVSELSALLRKGRVTVRDGTVGIRSAERNGEFITPGSVAPAVSNLLAAVRESGFYIAGLSQPIEPPTNGVLTVRVDAGRVGDVRVAFQGKEGEEGEAAADGRWYSADQIRRQFGKSAPGKPFDYGALYNALAEVNEIPDLAVDTDVKVRQEQGEDGMVKSLADLTLNVRESMPIHGGVELGNDGSKQSGNWWAGVSLRHQNLTLHDDVLSVEGQVALKDASMYAVQGSYLLPHHLWKGGTIGVYGGYSELNINNLIPDIGVSGMGRYAGLRVSQRLLDTRFHRIEVAIGQTFRWTTENLTFAGAGVDERNARVAPYYAQLSWQQKSLDALAGRTFAMVELSHNISDWLGASEHLDTMRVGANGDYTIGRAQVARLQALNSGSGEGLDSRWTLFVRAMGQLSDTPLVSMEQFGMGGIATVRGYEERELLGDDAALGSIELRTPVFRLFDGANAVNLRDRIQFVAFMDTGWVGLDKTQPGERGSTYLLSAGLGLRYALWQNALLRFDWGFPLKDTYDSESTGRGHLNLQLQF